MIRHSLIATLLFLSASLLTPSLSQESGVEVCNLRTESLSTPMGIDTPRPHFSWQLNSQRNGAAQKSYRLLLAESPEALQAYATHPAHVEVADTKVRPYTVQRVCLDFED